VIRRIPRLLIFSVVPALLGLAPELAAQSQVKRELMVKEVISPRMGGYETFMLPLTFGPDPNSAESHALFILEQDPTIRVAGWLGERFVVRRNGGRLARRGQESSQTLAPFAFHEMPATGLINSPLGLHLFCFGQNHSDIEVRDLDSGSQVRRIPNPDPPGTSKPMGYFRLVRAAGDVNADGWDDLFFQGANTAGDGVAGCLDGRTGQALWTDYSPSHQWVRFVPELLPGYPPDLDGDGVSDFVTSFAGYSFAFALKEQITAHSGVDGSILWRKDLPLNASKHPRWTVLGPDLNGNGTPDVVSLAHPQFSTSTFQGDLQARDGATGKLIWRTDLAWIKLLRPNATFWGVGNPLMIQLSPDGSSLDLLAFGASQGASNQLEYWYALIDAETGAYSLETISLDSSLLPWFPDPNSASGISNTRMNLGDTDGDGFQEVASQVFIYSQDSGASPEVPLATVIWGQRTLFGPEQAQLGTSAFFEIRLPAIPLAPFQLAASAHFDPVLPGWSPDGLPTHLRLDRALARTAAHPGLAGQLDANGQAALTVPIPVNPAYAGIVLHCRAIVLDPANLGRIRTQTTLWSMALMP
jgi:hypothetical protein